MVVSSDARQDLFDQETGEAFIILLTISHADLPQPIRVCNDGKDIISNGNTFSAFPFEIALPSDEGDQAPKALLRIDNVDRSIVAAVRSVSTSPDVQIDIIRASAPDDIEVSFPDFTFDNIAYDAFTVSGELTLENFLQEPYPAGVFDPSRFPGGF